MSQNSSLIYREPYAVWCYVEQLHIAPCNVGLRELLWLLASHVLFDFDEILMSFWPFEYPF